MHILDIVLDPEGFLTVVGHGIGDRYQGSAQRASEPVSNLAVVDLDPVEDAFDFFLDIENRAVADVSLGPAVRLDIAQNQDRALNVLVMGVLFLDFRIYGILPRDFAGFPKGGVFRKRAGPHVAVFNQNVIPAGVGPPAGIDLKTIAGYIINIAVADSQIK